ncbi:tumor necrosis factor receptor superfamily member 4 isoform X2 [Saimiri boliviensis]|uniref:tumor necrosis factor receptor superfamily member 4 isoform X2 n=1 Tax=Saimiri boliviensis TaxID=27679 RepID=UPI000533F0D7|nr:tumor necrosis factor receptor superfamily member 4 isoform X3 [Saimiri boliviensis boliviensis]
MLATWPGPAVPSIAAGAGGWVGKGTGAAQNRPRRWPGRDGPGALGAAGAKCLTSGEVADPWPWPWCSGKATLSSCAHASWGPCLQPPPDDPPSGPCSGSGSEQKQKCTATQDAVCRCRPGTEPVHSYKLGVDCAPCPPGHFSSGDNQPCKPWTNCTLAGKSTQQPASNSSDAVCEDRGPPATRPQGTRAPTARPTTARAIEAWSRTSQGPSTRPAEATGGPAVAAILGLGLALGLLGPLAMLLALHLLRRDLSPPPDALKPPGGGSFRTPIQEEQADAHSALAKI